MILRLLIFSFLLCWASTDSPNGDWTNLRSKFSRYDLLHLESFYQMPRTLHDAIEEGWVEPGELRGQRHIKTLCRKSKAYVCLLYNDKGAVAGYQISLPRVVDSLMMPGMDYTKKGYKATTMFAKQWYSITAYLESPDPYVPLKQCHDPLSTFTLVRTPDERACWQLWRSNKAVNLFTRGPPVSVTIMEGGRDGSTNRSLHIPLNGQIVEIPRNQKDLQDYYPEFKKQNCFSKMGTHFYYNLTRSLEPKYYQTIFLLYKNKHLIGFGINAFGSKSKPKSIRDYLPFAKRNWFEDVPRSAVREVAPDMPDWALNYMKDYGGFNHHVYFVDKPWNIDCDSE